ncbi:MAG: TonB-dependent receptor [Bacteroidales bacterium]|nr:TonB-dependent receptor [Bacteroidales bacterium]
MRTSIFILICLLATISTTMGQHVSFNISGLVRDAKSGESLPGANIYVLELSTGTSTNNYGYYSINLPKGKHRIVFSFVGYSSTELTIDTNTATRQDVLLKPSVELETVEVTAKSYNVVLPSMGVIQLPVQQAKNIPALLGEKDIMKAVQLLPGIQRGNEGTGGLFVRGGGYDQNLIILDDAIVYNANHLFGFFSLFNGDAIKDVKIIKGGFPARYGGRLSSVLDITMKEGNMEHYAGEAGIGLISSRFTIEGPIKKQRASFLLSGRRTYLGQALTPFMPEEGKFGYYFYDLNAKFNYIINDKNRLYLSGFWGKDALNTSYKDREVHDKGGLNWKNALLSMRLNSIFTSGLFMNNTMLVSKYNTGYSFHQKNTRESKKYVFDYYTGIRDYSIKTDFLYNPFRNHTFRFGVVNILHDFRPRMFNITNEFVNEHRKEVEKQMSFESAAYFENEYQGNHWMYNIGLRLSFYNAVDLNHLRPEPRITIGYKLSPLSSIKASYSDMNQYIHLMSNTGGLLPTDIWLPASGKILAQHSRQFSLGWDMLLKSIGTELTLESYYKKSSNVLTYRDGANFFFIDDVNPSADIDWAKNVTSGISDAWGVEVLLHKKAGRLNGWLAYTLSKALVQFNEINKGEKYPAAHDRRHDLALTLAYTITSRVHLSAAWIFMTGNPITIPYHTSATFKPLSFYGELQMQQSSTVDYYGNRNNYRTDNYHRLDISLRFTKHKKHGERIWEIGVYNAYNKMNAFAYNMVNDLETGKRVLRKTTIFPIIPSFSYVRRF